MTKMLTKLGSCALLCLLAIGCNLTYVDNTPRRSRAVRTRPVVVHHHHPEPQPVVVVQQPVVVHHQPVAVRHVHSRHCGCVYHGGGFVVIDKGHRHGPGCGHQYNGEYWISVSGGRAQRVR